MSFVPPQGRSQLELEASKARVQEAQERALHYADQHPGEGATLGAHSRLRGILKRARAALSRDRPGS